MTDALASVVRTSLDLHFGRLSFLAPPHDHDVLIEAASTLLRQISEQMLGQESPEAVDPGVLRHIFEKDGGLPNWLVTLGLQLCDNNQDKLEETVTKQLNDQFNLRRYVDYICGEIQYHCWEWSNKSGKRRLPLRCSCNLSVNEFCNDLNARYYVLKLDDNILFPNGTKDPAYHWYIRSIGSISLIDYATEPLYDYTTQMLDFKYKMPLVLDVFKRLFESAWAGEGLERFGVLVLGDVPKTFSLSDFQAATRTPVIAPTARGAAMELVRHLLSCFDNQSARAYPEARFRLGEDVPAALANRIGAIHWLRRTLDKVNGLQQQKIAPAKGHRVKERTVLAQAMEQKSLLYFRLFDDPNDSTVNPCHIRAINDFSMIVQSPRGNRLNEAWPGQEIHGYFSIVAVNQKSIFCDFRCTVTAVNQGEDGGAMVEIGIPATFELTRRSHKRAPISPRTLGLFSLSAPPPQADWAGFTSLDSWPGPLCVIPDPKKLCSVKDLSAGGLMLEIHRTAPAYDYFVDRNKHAPLLARMHLTGHINAPKLNLAIRLEAKRIRDVLPLQTKYVGFQFTEVGEIRDDRFVRFAPVGKDGVYLINDWIFRNSM